MMEISYFGELLLVVIRRHYQSLVFTFRHYLVLPQIVINLTVKTANGRGSLTPPANA